MPSNAIDGPIRTGVGELTEKRYMPFPFDQAALDKGKEPWDVWILCCDVCPWREDPPEQVLRWYEQRREIVALIREYEGAESLEARQAMMDAGKLA